jgi:hypothetical protein
MIPRMSALVVTSRPPHREALPLVGYEVPSVVAVSNVRTVAKTQLGGLNDGLTRPAYRGATWELNCCQWASDKRSG